jgi:DNA polymerase-3 subunit delta'
VTPLHGHDHAVAAFRDSLDGGRLHHAWLISGPEGVGKALFAGKAALRVLAAGQGSIAAPGLDVPDDHPAARLAAAGSHPDLMRLERLVKETSSTGELARSITVDQVRSLQRLFSTTASFSPWRVVVIDAIDDLERNAANALLKNLEEPPPHSLFLLVSHSPERLLPTIRSRCRQLRLSTLGQTPWRLPCGLPSPTPTRGRSPTSWSPATDRRAAPSPSGAWTLPASTGRCRRWRGKGTRPTPGAPRSPRAWR